MFMNFDIVEFPAISEDLLNRAISLYNLLKNTSQFPMKKCTSYTTLDPFSLAMTYMQHRWKRKAPGCLMWQWEDMMVQKVQVGRNVCPQPTSKAV